jgi:SAM-dependent methyltransferase
VNYAAQDRFFVKYRSVAAVAALAIVAWFSWALPARFFELGPYGAMLLALVGAGIVYCLCYLPLYLLLAVEYRKRFAWSVRVRWVLLGVLAVATIPVLSESGRWMAWSASVLGAIVAILLCRALLRSARTWPIELIPIVLLASDYAALFFATRYGSLPIPAATVGLAFAWLLCVLGLGRPAGASRKLVQQLLFGHIVLLIFFGQFLPATSSPQLYLLPPIVLIAAVLLVGIAERHHRENVAQTIAELSEFARVTPAEATDMLVRATSILAASWNDKPPSRPDEVARWYSENSRYYLYDLAQFHLAYKHIAFMRDVLSLARGRVLDHGAGIGDVALELARRGHETTYLDVDGVTKTFARWRAEREWLPVAFASTLDEAPGPFDSIVSLDVLEHISDPEAEVDALIARLAPGGRIVVTAYFGPTKAHPMHFDHRLDLGAYLSERGLRDVKNFALRHLRSEFMGKAGVLVYEK